MHRRTNSYSYTASDLNKIVPPPLVLSKLANTQQNDEFLRNAEERRSYRKPISSLSANKGYCSVGIPQALPASIRFSVNFEEFEMHRPRSPVKPPSKGAKQSPPDSFSVPSLDSALAEIKEQLIQMKVERIEIVERIDCLVVGINESSKELAQQRLIAQRSPAQGLRRIHSLEGRTYSHTQLPTDCISPTINEISDFSSTSSSSLETSSPNVFRHARRDSLPANSLRGVGHSPVARTNSKSKQGALLPTIHDATVLDDVDSSSDESQVSPKVVPVSPNQKIADSKSASVWSKSPSANSYNSFTLPSKRSQSPLYYSKVESSFDGFAWDKASLTSADSMVMQVSSATGQLERIPKTSKKALFSPGSMDHLNMSHKSSNLSNRFSVSSYFIGPGFEDTDSMIMKLSEEPGPRRLSTSSSRSSSVSSQRNSLVFINAKETTV